MPHRLTRLFKPRSVAVVGASESQPRSNSSVGAMLEAGLPLHLVNPNRATAYGRPTSPNLSAIDEPIDAVFVLTGAATAVEVTREAASLGVGGVVVIGAGFGEAGPDGAELERRLIDAAAGTPVLGPNCNGFINVISGARLSGAPRMPLVRGSLGFITHSGATIGPMGIAGVERGVGFSFLISTGNEAVVDVSECIDFLADDEATRAICLLIETIRRPQAFFESVRRALDAGKPVVALKNGRSRRGREIATSHTGALAGEAWVYESAFRQHGIGIARDLVDLADRMVLFGQLPSSRWPRARGLAIVSGSGGWAAMASDVCEEEGIALPALSALRDHVARVIPGVTTVNPLDLTGAAMTRPQIMESVLTDFAACPEVDTMVVLWPVVAETLQPGNAFVEPARTVAARTNKLVMVSSIEGGQLGPFASELIKEGIGVGRGLRSTMRAIETAGRFARDRERRRSVPAQVPTIAQPDGPPIASAAGPAQMFSDTMAMLCAAGIPIAPFRVFKATEPVIADGLEFDAPFVVKLADIPHRAQVNAVRQHVPAVELKRVADELRRLAAELGAPAEVVVQQQLKFDLELFMGAKIETDLGPIAACGLGGNLVELLGRVAGLLAPFTPGDADHLLAELDERGIFAAAQTRRGWDRSELASIFVKVGGLAAGAQAWMSSLDINPLGFGADGFMAVDGLCILRTPALKNALIQRSTV